MIIRTQKELKSILLYEYRRYFPHNRSALQIVKQRFEHNLTDRIWTWQKWLRMCEYLEGKNGLVNHIRMHIARRNLNKLGEKLNIEIYPGNFEKGLLIWHTGIVVNNHARIGINCELHGNNCIGNRGGGATEGVPILGNNVDIGYGAVVIGAVHLADNIKVGANAVVNHTCDIVNTVLVGVPAKKLNE